MPQVLAETGTDKSAINVNTISIESIFLIVLPFDVGVVTGDGFSEGACKAILVGQFALCRAEGVNHKSARI